MQIIIFSGNCRVFIEYFEYPDATPLHHSAITSLIVCMNLIHVLFAKENSNEQIIQTLMKLTPCIILMLFLKFSGIQHLYSYRLYSYTQDVCINAI